MGAVVFDSVHLGWVHLVSVHLGRVVKDQALVVS